MFEWDEEKNRRNAAKHGVRFEVAVRIFDGRVLTHLDEGDHDEIREISIGMVGAVVTLTVVHTDRNGRTRLISARMATRSERRRYEQILS